MRTIHQSQQCCTPTQRFWFDEFLSNHSEALKGENAFTQTPNVNIFENENELVFEFALPGVEKDQVKVNYENSVLSIASQINSNENKNESGFLRKEFSTRNYSRSFKLNEKKYDGENAFASMKNGILSVFVPFKKSDINKIGRQIEIK